MGDQMLRIVISIISTLILVAVYYAGYISGVRGWWWTVFSIIIMFAIIYKLVDV